MKIESITIRNFKALGDAKIENIPAFAVFVGRNGSGKSTLFDVFGFLKDALSGNIRQALSKRGGYREVVTRGRSDQGIQIEIQFRMWIGATHRLVTYHLSIKEDNDRVPYVDREVLRYKRGSYGSPFHFLDFSKGEGFAIVNEDESLADTEMEREDHALDSADILAVKGLGQFQRFRAASEFRKLIENWHVSDFYINAARGSRDAGYAEHLSESGDNLPLVAQYMHERHPDIFESVVRRMQQRVPGISEIEVATTTDGRLVLKYHDGSFKDPFFDRFVSDGTVKMFAYLILLYDPKPHPLLCVEEPENQLYPDLLQELAEEFREYATRGGQVFVSTHSPDFLNGVKLDEIYWLDKTDGISRVHRANDSELLRRLVAEGDLPGYLWKQQLFM